MKPSQANTLLRKLSSDERFRRRIFWTARFASLVAVAAFACGLPAPCRANILVLSPGVLAAPGSTGSFDVVLQNTNPSGGASIEVAGDTLELSLVGLSGVKFTSVTIATLTPYIYVNSATLNGGGPLSLDTFPNTLFHASDTEFAAPGFRTVVPGATFGLAHVSFSVPIGVSGAGTLVVGPDTSLSDPNGGSITLVASSGYIRVDSSTPEPASLMLLIGGGLGIAVLSLRRRPAMSR